ncbi:hypothetical protein GOQ27_07280 [Clostridium sp. D2Q-11]|uniref:Uncharacterized protein n=1 Tax=Anaeromonas frigoriresistens TaxID=2683708 RepID=A0A942UUI9_9FIRM|nr:hypothetical protein [Anaeromonas frigoriresistens]MBS4538260.1 hypothetical protein [Anaeromonas frigoriresistens]
MNHEIKKISKIIDELSTFCLLHGAKLMNMSVENNKDHFKIILEMDNLDYSNKKVSRLEKLLNCPRQAEMEEFYWELTGESDHDSELSIVGMMVDKADIVFEENSLKLTLYRYK